MTDISIIIPNFNGAKYLKACLESLKIAILNSPSSKFEIILVDNGSTDNSLKLFGQLSKKLPQCSSIKLKTNTGFAHAVNQGIKAAKYDYVCLINNDLNLDKLWFKEIIKHIKLHPNMACFCGTILNLDKNKIESQGISFDWSGKCLQNNFSPTKLLNHSSLPVWGSSAAAVIYKKKIIENIGLFDEKYFAYIEDVDLSFRLFKKGFKTLLIPKALAYHLGGGTTNKMGNFRAKQVLKNWIYFISKNYLLKEIFIHFPQIIIERLRNVSYLIKSTLI